MSSVLATTRQRVLFRARELWRGGFVTLDLETTGLSSADQIIQWAVCDQESNLLGWGYVKPTVEISVGAFEVHGITLEQLEGAPTFDQAWPDLSRLLMDQMVVCYNADFEKGMLWSSAFPYKEISRPRIKTSCAMNLFAAFYGQTHEYYGGYTWKSLEVAVAQLRIEVEGQAHDARYDAAATAMIIKRLAEIADKELPEGWHPPVSVKCAGGCNNVVRDCWSPDEVWYCTSCGLARGLFHRCPKCNRVEEVRSTGIYLDDLCRWCHKEQHQGKMLVMKLYHYCPGKGHRYQKRVVETSDPTELCHDCKEQQRWRAIMAEEERKRQEKLAAERKEYKKAYSKAYRERKKEEARVNKERADQGLPLIEKPIPPDPYAPFTSNGHHFQREKLDNGQTRVVCSICTGWWSRPPKTGCNGIKTYWSWKSIPKHLKTKTQLKQLHLKLAPDQPHVALMETSYSQYALYDMEKCAPTKSRAKAETEEDNHVGERASNQAGN